MPCFLYCTLNPDSSLFFSLIELPLWHISFLLFFFMDESQPCGNGIDKLKWLATYWLNSTAQKEGYNVSINVYRDSNLVSYTLINVLWEEIDMRRYIRVYFFRCIYLKCACKLKLSIKNNDLWNVLQNTRLLQSILVWIFFSTKS